MFFPMSLGGHSKLCSGIYMAESAMGLPDLRDRIHVFAIVTVFGTIAVMDMRMIGLASKRPARSTAVSKDTLTPDLDGLRRRGHHRLAAVHRQGDLLHGQSVVPSAKWR